MQFPKRIQTIGNLIPEGAYVADVGADHGLLEQFITLHKKDYHILAIENKEGPYKTLRQNTECLKNVIVSNSDGLNVVTKEYDTVVLAGMGGDNIINILERNSKKLKKINHIIVDAHSFIPKVREYLTNKGFDIDSEQIVYESRIYYIVISFKRNSVVRKYTKDELEFGYKIYLDPLYKEYKKRELNKLNTVRKYLEKLKFRQPKYYDVLDTIRRLELYGQD